METPCPDFELILAGHFDQGTGYDNWRTRGTKSWLLIYTLSGCGRFGHIGGEFRAMPGEMTLLAPNTLHDYGVEGEYRRWEIVWAHFYPYPHWLDWLKWPEVAPGLMRLKLEDRSVRERAAEKFMEAYRLSVGPSRRRAALAMNALESVLIHCDLQNPRSDEDQWDPRVHAAVEYLIGHLSEPFSLPRLAGHTRLSVSRIAHLFREQTGVTPRGFLERKRLDRAKLLLEYTSHPVESIGREVGYDDPFYFSKRFKVSTGMNPRDYRKSRKGETNDSVSTP